jgi:hypothetical protein
VVSVVVDGSSWWVGVVQLGRVEDGSHDASSHFCDIKHLDMLSNPKDNKCQRRDDGMGFATMPCHPISGEYLIG